MVPCHTRAGAVCAPAAMTRAVVIARITVTRMALGFHSAPQLFARPVLGFSCIPLGRHSAPSSALSIDVGLVFISLLFSIASHWAEELRKSKPDLLWRGLASGFYYLRNSDSPHVHQREFLETKSRAF